MNNTHDTPEAYRPVPRCRAINSIVTMIRVKSPTVLLRHDLPDHSHHYDWLLDLLPSPPLPLTTFRLPALIHELQPGSQLPAQRIVDHRRAYLTYEGPITDNRGSVMRVAGGHIETLATPTALTCKLELTIHWEQPKSITQHLLLRCNHCPDAIPQRWTIFCIAKPTQNP